MKKSSLQEADYLIAWAVVFLFVAVGNAIVGFVGGGLIRRMGAIVGFILSMPVSYLTFRFVVAKFIVEKVESQPSNVIPIPQAHSAPAPQTNVGSH
jgi:hypothetical protein